MSLFDLHTGVVRDYQRYVPSFLSIADERDLRYIIDPTDIYGPDFPGENFRVLKEKEIARYGEYRTKRLVLEAWQRLAEKGTVA